MSSAAVTFDKLMPSTCMASSSLDTAEHVWPVLMGGGMRKAALYTESDSNKCHLVRSPMVTTVKTYVKEIGLSCHSSGSCSCNQDQTALADMVHCTSLVHKQSTRSMLDYTSFSCYAGQCVVQITRLGTFDGSTCDELAYG